MKRLLIVLGCLFLESEVVFAVPDTTITISPTCTSGTNITCSDNTSRMNSISTGYNSHSHADIPSTSANTYTVGNGAAGAKAFAIDNQYTTSPSLRYVDTTGVWQFTNDASTFNTFANTNQVTFTTGNGTANNIALAISNNFTTSPSIRYNRALERWQSSDNASTFIDFGGTYSRVHRTAGNVTTTSTSLTDFTGASITVSTAKAAPALVGWTSVCNNSDATDKVIFNVDVDGTNEFGTIGVQMDQAVASENADCSFTMMTSVLTVASHTVKLRWNVSAAGTATTLCSSSVPCNFWVISQ